MTLGRLEKIAEVLDVPVSQVLHFDSSAIFNFHNNNYAYGKIEQQTIVNDENLVTLLSQQQELIKKVVELIDKK